MKKSILILVLFLFVTGLTANAQSISQGYKVIENISYQSDDAKNTDEYLSKRCVLDVFYPENSKDFATVVWFHGGSLKEGEKYFPKELMNKNIAIIAVNYRMNPRVEYPVYIEDAAASVAWAFENIESYGGDKNKIFVSGHSAGGYLTLMVGLDPQWLQAYNIDFKNIAGLFPVSGQTLTHLTIREELELDERHRLADELSPLYNTRADAPPLFLITGDRDLEITARYEENALLYAYMKSMNKENNHLFELAGFNHGTVVAPACFLIVEQINKMIKKED